MTLPLRGSDGARSTRALRFPRHVLTISERSPGHADSLRLPGLITAGPTILLLGPRQSMITLSGTFKAWNHAIKHQSMITLSGTFKAWNHAIKQEDRAFSACTVSARSGRKCFRLVRTLSGRCAPSPVPPKHRTAARWSPTSEAACQTTPPGTATERWPESCPVPH
jgi:hypothetical protein